MGLLQRTRQRGVGLVRLLTFKSETPTSLAAHLERWARTTPDRTFLIFEGQRWTWRLFDREVAHRAAVLAHHGVKRGDAVALMMDNRPAFLRNALALNRLGAVPALINTKLVKTGLRHAVLVSKPTTAVVGHEYVDAWTEAFHGGSESLDLVQLIEAESGPLEEVPDDMHDLLVTDSELPQQRAPLVLPEGTDPAAYIYTSGTTGLPKAGKVLNARCDMAAIGFGMLAAGLEPDDVIYCCLPMFHSNGFLVAMSGAIFTGATLALARKFSASRFWDDINDTGATAFVYIGEVCRYLLNTPTHAGERTHSVRYVMGNGLRPEIWDDFVERFEVGKVYEFYGATEGNVNMINITSRRGSVGRIPAPLDNTMLVRFDHDTQNPVRDAKGRCIKCKVGEVGELLGKINPDRVTQRFDGYLDGSATSKKVLRDVKKKGDAWFRSGDLLRKDWLGYYYFVDRIGDTFRWKGENVSTNEVADVVQRHDDVDIANVYGVEVPGADGRAGMVTVVANGSALDPEQFYKHCDERLPAFALPAFLRIASAAQLTATFKLRKVDLVKQGFDPSKTDDPMFYRDDGARTYIPINTDVYEKVLRGELRF